MTSAPFSPLAVLRACCVTPAPFAPFAPFDRSQDTQAFDTPRLRVRGQAAGTGRRFPVRSPHKGTR